MDLESKIPPRICGVYSITKLVNGKKYIGSSINVGERRSAHLRDLLRGSHHSIALQRAWNKYGIKNFDFAIIKKCEVELLLFHEQKCINLFRAVVPTGYNISSSAYKVEIPYEVRCAAMRACAHKLSADAKRQWKDPIIRAKMIASMQGTSLGRKHSTETIAKIVIANKCTRDANPAIGMKHSNSMRAVWATAEHRAKLRAIHSDPEYSARLSKVHKNRWTKELRAAASAVTTALTPKYTHNGVTQSLTVWASVLGVPKGRLLFRIRNGFPENEVFFSGKLKSGRKPPCGG